MRRIVFLLTLLISFSSFAQDWLAQIKFLASSPDNAEAVVTRIDTAFAHQCSYGFKAYTAESFEEAIQIKSSICQSQPTACLKPARHWPSCICRVEKENFESLRRWWESYVNLTRRSGQIELALNIYDDCGYHEELSPFLLESIFGIARLTPKTFQAILKWAESDAAKASAGSLEARLEMLLSLWFDTKHMPIEIQAAESINQVHAKLLQIYVRKPKFKDIFWAKHLSENLLHRNTVIGDYLGVFNSEIDYQKLAKASQKYLAKVLSDRCFAARNLGRYDSCRKELENAGKGLRGEYLKDLNHEWAWLHYLEGNSAEAQKFLQAAGEKHSFWNQLLDVKISEQLGQVDNASKKLDIAGRSRRSRPDVNVYYYLERARLDMHKEDVSSARRNINSAAKIAESELKGKGALWKAVIKEDIKLSFMERAKSRFEELFAIVKGDKNLHPMISFYGVMYSAMIGGDGTAKAYEEFYRHFKKNDAFDRELKNFLRYKPKSGS